MTSIRSCHTLSRNLAIPLRPYRSVENVYEKLAETPNMYSLCLKPLLSRRGYRRVPIGGYLMIYKVDDEAGLIYIERFFSHLEDYENLL